MKTVIDTLLLIYSFIFAVGVISEADKSKAKTISVCFVISVLALAIINIL